VDPRRDGSDALGLRNRPLRLTLRAEERLYRLSAVTRAAILVENDLLPTARLDVLGFPSHPFRGRIPIEVVVFDPEAALDPAGNGTTELIVEYSVEGGAFRPASTVAIGGISQPSAGRPAGVFPTERKTRLLWDASADIGPLDHDAAVTLRVTPRNTQAGIAGLQGLTYSDRLAFTRTVVSAGYPQNEPPYVGFTHDLDRDGIVDLVLLDPLVGRINTVFGKADGEFQWRGQSLSYGQRMFGLALADLDGDGREDLVGATSSTASCTCSREMRAASSRSKARSPTSRSRRTGTRSTTWRSSTRPATACRTSCSPSGPHRAAASGSRRAPATAASSSRRRRSRRARSPSPSRAATSTATASSTSPAWTSSTAPTRSAACRSAGSRPPP
jgi:hypothetical protein